MLRRLHPDQPESFAFTPANDAWARAQMTKYPEGRQASAIIPLLWRAQEQEGWLTRPAIEHVADMLGMPYIRALEVATFYFMFQLQPVGSVAHVQVCGTTSCMICGAEDLIGVCRDRIAPNAHELSADGKFSWEEVECLGACANAPMAQIGKDYYEDLTAEKLAWILDEFAADTGGRYYTSSQGFALNVAIELSDSLSLTSITGYDTGKYRNSPFDCDGSPNSVCALRYNSFSKNFNQDLRLNFKGDRFNAVAGLYYGVDKIDTRNEIDFFGVLKPILQGAGVPNSFFNAPVSAPQAAAFVPAFAVDPTLDPTNPASCAAVPTGNSNGFLDARSLIALLTDIQLNNSGGGGFGGAISAACRAAGAPPFGPIEGEQRYTIKRPSAAIYFDGSYDITDALTVSVGLRYTMDKVKYLNGRTVLYDLGGTIRASTIPYTFPYDASVPALRQEEKANRLTGRINVSYDFADDVMGYLNYSRGYRSGSFNGLAYQGTNQVYYIEPEQINAYEGGLKMRFFDRRVQLNLAGFYYDYKNHQVTQVIGATTFTRSANGRLYGGEAELTIQAADSLRLDASMSLLRSKYKGNVIDPTDPSSPTRNVNGNPFPNAPRTTFSAGFDWDVFESGDNKLTLRGDAAYTGKYYFDPFGDYGQTPCDRPGAPGNVRPAGPAITCGNPGYWLVNSRLTFEHGNYAASLWVKNLTNKYYYSYGLNIDIFGLDYLNRGTPRTYGVELTAKF